MTSTAEQITEFQRNWLEQQQELMSNWFGTLQKAAESNTPKTTWTEAIDTLEKQVDSALEMQQRSITTLLKTVEDSLDDTFDTDQLEQQLEEGVNIWTDVQHRLWEVWFEMLRHASPVEQLSNITFAKNWQEFVDQTMDIQKQAFSGILNSFSTSGESSGKQPATPSASKATSEKQESDSPGKKA
jgi:hypothetical protein